MGSRISTLELTLQWVQVGCGDKADLENYTERDSENKCFNSLTVIEHIIKDFAKSNSQVSKREFPLSRSCFLVGETSA